MTAEPITVKPVEGKDATETFIRLPGQIAANDPNWVEPLWFERRRFLTPRHNPFFAHAEVALWLAYKGDRPVGRISAQVDELAPPVDGQKVGFFGMIAAEDDPAITAALLATAEGWLAQRGCAVIRGPFDFSVNQTSGLLVDGFDLPPSLMMNHDQPWMGPAVEAAGFAKAKDLVAYRMDCSGGLPERMRRLGDRMGEGVTIRSIDMKNYDAEIRLITGIFNDAWADNWGFIPLTEAEIDAMAEEMKPIIDPGLVKVAEVNGEPVAFIVLLPNLNEALAEVKGRLWPFGWLKLIWRIKVTGQRSARVPLMGVKRSHAATMLGKTLPLKLIYALQTRTLARGIGELELSWLLEDNLPVRRVIESIGGACVKTYRIYEKRLG